MSAVRHIAPAAEAATVAIGAFEHAVAIWSLRPIEQLASFPTILDFGGNRLGLTPDGSSCIAGAYHVDGIACYDCSSAGTLRWQRRDLKKVQSLRPSVDGSSVYCFFDDGPGLRLQVGTGRTLDRLRGARDIQESPFSPIDFVSRTRLELRGRDGDLLFSLPRATFAVLSVAFSPGCVAISESSGPVRFVDLAGRDTLCQYSPSPGRHVLRLGYCPEDRFFYGIEWPYSRGGAKELLRFMPERQLASSVVSLEQPTETEFCLGGRSLLTSDGTLINLGSLTSTQIAFGESWLAV